MSKTKFTPGPWYVASDMPAYAIYAENGKRVVQTPNQNNLKRWGPSDRGHGIDYIPDANLIAAAPDLYAALDALANGYAGNGWDIGLAPRIERARVALAKARNGQPTRPEGE